jgi:hypothetical protein
MAEKDDFKFPDEIENEGKPVENDEFTLEIEEDTPEVDRNVKPMDPKDIEEIEKDNFENHSNRVKLRIEQLKKVWHDERRAKESAVREQQEAVELARRIMEENKKLKATLTEGEKQFVSTVQNNAELEIEMAKRAYHDAYDSGDAGRIIDAQQKLTEATLKQDKAKNFRPTIQVEERFEGAKQPEQQQQQKMDPLTSKWLEKNNWYGPDEEMTALALGTHSKLEKEFGKSYIGTQEYFDRIDQTMRKRFPENFSDDVEADSQAGGDKPSQRSEARKGAPVVAAATRSTAAKRIVLKASQVALAKKLGLSPEQYARELQKLEA